jgi:hypothetical protein
MKSKITFLLLLFLAMGDTAEDKVIEITEERLLLLDKDGTTKYDWKRVPQDDPGKE